MSSRNIKNAFKSSAIKNSHGKFHYGQGIEGACFCATTLLNIKYVTIYSLLYNLRPIFFFLFKIHAIKIFTILAVCLLFVYVAVFTRVN